MRSKTNSILIIPGWGVSILVYYNNVAKTSQMRDCDRSRIVDTYIKRHQQIGEQPGWFISGAVCACSRGRFFCEQASEWTTLNLYSQDQIVVVGWVECGYLPHVTQQIAFFIVASLLTLGGPAPADFQPMRASFTRINLSLTIYTVVARSKCSSCDVAI